MGFLLNHWFSNIFKRSHWFGLPFTFLWQTFFGDQFLWLAVKKNRINPPGTWIKQRGIRHMYQQKAAKNHRYGVSLIPTQLWKDHKNINQKAIQCGDNKKDQEKHTLQNRIPMPIRVLFMETHVHNILKMMELYDKHGETVPLSGWLGLPLGSRQNWLFGSHVTLWIEPHAEGRMNS